MIRNAHAYPRTLRLMGSGKIDVKPFVTDTLTFKEGIRAFEYACAPKPDSVKAQIEMP